MGRPPSPTENYSSRAKEKAKNSNTSTDKAIINRLLTQTNMTKSKKIGTQSNMNQKKVEPNTQPQRNYLFQSIFSAIIFKSKLELNSFIYLQYSHLNKKINFNG